MEARPLSERSSLGTSHPSVLSQLARLLVRRLLARLWWPAGMWSETEWHDLFGAECTLRRPVASLVRAWATVFKLGYAYYRRR